MASNILEGIKPVKIREVEAFIRQATHPVTIYEMLQYLAGRGVTFKNRKVIDMILTRLKKRVLVKQDEFKRYFSVEHAPAPAVAPQGDQAALADVKAALAELWRLFNVVAEDPAKLDNEILNFKADVINKGVNHLE